MLVGAIIVGGILIGLMFLGVYQAGKRFYEEIEERW